ncbi:MAG: phosphoribosylpyrophosphate synthetase, partial [Pseudomonadota bacterium]
PEVSKAENIRIVPIAPIFTQAITNVWSGTSVSSLFEKESLAPIYDGFYASA